MTHIALCMLVAAVHRRYHESLSNLTPAESTSDAAKLSCWKEKGSNGTQSKNVACSIKRKPHKLKQDEPVTPVVHTAICLKAFDDGQSFQFGAGHMSSRRALCSVASASLSQVRLATITRLQSNGEEMPHHPQNPPHSRLARTRQGSLLNLFQVGVLNVILAWTTVASLGRWRML